MRSSIVHHYSITGNIMYVRLKKAASGILSIIGAAALLMAGAFSDAQGQTFEHTYGGSYCAEAGRGGVQPP